MKIIFKLLIWLFFVVITSCQKPDNLKLYLVEFNEDKYYSTEIIPKENLNIYGKWKIMEISGGFSGSGYTPDFDFLEIKPVGIYGIINDYNLTEYGKIVVYTFDNNNKNYLQIKFIPENSNENNLYLGVPEKYVNIIGRDSLDLISPCCDMYNYHFKRIK